MSSAGHVFWWLLVGAALVWYSTVTILVAVRGGYDIRDMLTRLDAQHKQNQREK